MQVFDWFFDLLLWVAAGYGFFSASLDLSLGFRWFVPRQRHRMLAEALLACRETELLASKLLQEAEANHTDQQLHWWAWWELYRVLEVPRERREHASSTTDPDPGPALLPTLGSLDPARGAGSGGGGRFDFPL